MLKKKKVYWLKTCTAGIIVMAFLAGNVAPVMGSVSDVVISWQNPADSNKAYYSLLSGTDLSTLATGIAYDDTWIGMSMLANGNVIAATLDAGTGGTYRHRNPNHAGRPS